MQLSRPWWRTLHEATLFLAERCAEQVMAISRHQECASIHCAIVAFGFATVIATGALASSDASAQPSFEVLHVFPPAPGLYPRGPLVQATDGNLYGITNFGGTFGWGTIFRM